MNEPDTHDDEQTRVERSAEMGMARVGKWIAALVALLGLWLVVGGFVLDPITATFWSDIIVGAALIALGGYSYYRRASQRVGSVTVAAGAFVALLGLWVIATPFVFEPDGFGAVEFTLETWNNVLAGAIVFAFGAYNTYEARRSAAATTGARA